MSVAVTCPECASAVKVPERLLGRRVKCTQCESPFLARPPKPVAKEPSFDDPPAGPKTRPPKRTPRVVWAVAALGVLVFAFSVVMMTGKPRVQVAPPVPGFHEPPVLRPAAESAWKPYRGPGFVVDVPGEPVSVTSQLRFGGAEGQTVVEVSAGNCKYTVYSRPFPVVPANPQAEVALLADQLPRGIAGFSPRDKKFLTVGNCPAARVRLWGNVNGAMQIVAAGKLLIVLAAESRFEINEDTPDVARFFQSFQLMPGR